MPRTTTTDVNRLAQRRPQRRPRRRPRRHPKRRPMAPTTAPTTESRTVLWKPSCRAPDAVMFRMCSPQEETQEHKRACSTQHRRADPTHIHTAPQTNVAVSARPAVHTWRDQTRLGFPNTYTATTTVSQGGAGREHAPRCARERGAGACAGMHARMCVHAKPPPHYMTMCCAGHAKPQCLCLRGCLLHPFMLRLHGRPADPVGRNPLRSVLACLFVCSAGRGARSVFRTAMVRCHSSFAGFVVRLHALTGLVHAVSPVVGL